jgi:hypothetical protein
MRFITAMLAPIGLVLWAGTGWAEPLASILVERGAGAEPCADADSLRARIEEIRGRRMGDVAHGYRVAFAHKEGVFSAVITGPSGANRQLESRGATCTVLANATAITLTLLLDSEVAEKTPLEPPAVAPTEIEIAPLPPVRRSRNYSTVSIGTVGLAGILRPFSSGLAADVGIGGPDWRASVGALWDPPRASVFGPGTIEEQSWSGAARACFAPARTGALRFDVCSGIIAGVIMGEARGFTVNEKHARPWVAVPFELALVGFTLPIGWELGVSALVPVRRDDFSIDGLGVTYHSPSIGGMLSLRLIGIVPW